ncbi:MAG: SPFH domain-containing protein [Acidimicrobiales bacterium]
MSSLAVAVVVFGALAAAVLALLAVAWRVPAADEALVVTGWRPRVVRRRGTFVWPQVERAARVDLSLHVQTVDVDLAAAEGIAFRIGLECSWQVGGDETAIVAAARHFFRRPDFAGHQIEGSMAARMRSAIGALPAAALLDAGVGVDLAARIRGAVAADLQPLGLVVVSLDIARIGDTSGYLADLTRPHLARAASDARIATAEADAAAVEAEQRSRLVQDRAAGRDPGIARSAS